MVYKVTAAQQVNEDDFAVETGWVEFQMAAMDSPVVFMGKTKEVTVVQMGLTPLPMLTFEEIQFIKGEKLAASTFPYPGSVEEEKLIPGESWFVALKKIKGTDEYEIKSMASITERRSLDLAQVLVADARRKSAESWRP